LRWFTEADVNVAADDELLGLMRDSGCQQILIGLESPHRASLDGVELNSNWKARQQDHYQEAIAKGNDNPDVRTDLGNSFRFSGQPEKALEQYTIAQRQNPQHENSLFNQIGLFMEVVHDPIRAIPVCEEFIKRFPNSEKVPRVREQLQIAKNL
jgi:tetratricopeptide (TPR) repeat protein